MHQQQENPRRFTSASSCLLVSLATEAEISDRIDGFCAALEGTVTAAWLDWGWGCSLLRPPIPATVSRPGPLLAEPALLGTYMYMVLSMRQINRPLATSRNSPGFAWAKAVAVHLLLLREDAIFLHFA